MVDYVSWSGFFSLRSCWGDVLVEPEQVGGVVGLLQFGEPWVVVPVGCANAFLALGAEVVDVGGAFQVWLHGGEECPGPFDVARGVVGVGPLGQNKEVVLFGA